MDNQTMEWACIGHNPTTWALGILEKGENSLYLKDIYATVVRQKNGSWLWKLTPQFQGEFGIEPSRLLAIQAVDTLYKRGKGAYFIK